MVPQFCQTAAGNLVRLSSDGLCFAMDLSAVPVRAQPKPRVKRSSSDSFLPVDKPERFRQSVHEFECDLDPGALKDTLLKKFRETNPGMDVGKVWLSSHGQKAVRQRL